MVVTLDVSRGGIKTREQQLENVLYIFVTFEVSSSGIATRE